MTAALVLVPGLPLLAGAVLGIWHVAAGLPTDNAGRSSAAGYLGYIAGGPLTSGLTAWLAVPLLVIIGLFGVLLVIAMFTPLKFIHPVRTERWRAVSLPMAVAWVVFALWALAVRFHPQSWALWGLVVSSAWLTFAGIALGTAAALILFHGMTALNRLTRAVQDPEHLEDVGAEPSQLG